jgi:hypothetical protein
MTNGSLIFKWSHLRDWDQITQSLIDREGKEISPSNGNWNLKTQGYQEIYNKWVDAKFNMQSIKWINYYPAVDYDTNIIDIFQQQLKVTHIRSWISRIDPGYCAAWHWDVDDYEAEYVKLGNIKRFTCHIGNTDPGHAFMVGNSCLHNEKNGDVFQWSDYRAWHGGMNCGLIPKFMFNFLGYDQHKTSF